LNTLGGERFGAWLKQVCHRFIELKLITGLEIYGFPLYGINHWGMNLTPALILASQTMARF